ncbi:Gfo/Idh/MocA family protein [Streptacidiphilus fuscans]|uniref:Gfo/Idh/MocA family oxidoreductase n=1 Tax=Streptacidiphilus fuscans TaxID=2789292 RepID=A0A931B4B5_9ACTN|nr:Gfo/Idh/MocA family oxidoreductase [Streptacidiphilus fuscans]MBF9068442.1 Gfo/Idh/MocA family oxidoreductase [Streptacidiphilus fuscans]
MGHPAPPSASTVAAVTADTAETAPTSAPVSGPDTELRIGVLGAAAIAPTALIKPAAQTPRVTVAAVAARDRSRAEIFARKHGVPVIHDDYDALLADPSIDAVYIPLPNGLHAEWMLKALDAGKHVLCEKPFTANRAEAELVAKAADAAYAERGLVVMEAFHYRYHPLAERMREITASGELGEIRRIEAQLCFPLPKFQDIRYSYALAGGAMMDAGCYALHVARLLGDGGGVGDPRVVSARASTLRQDPRIDRAMEAELAFEGGATGRVRASLWSRRVLSMRARVVGTEGELSVFNFVAPQVFHRLTVRSRRAAGGSSVVRRERISAPSSYACQLAAFTAAVLDGGPVLTPPRDAVVTMGLLDDVYRAAGLPLRGAPEEQEAPE